MIRRRGDTPPEPFDTHDTGRDHIRGAQPTTKENKTMDPNLNGNPLFVRYINTMLDLSRCPRCGQEFDTRFVAGSRITEDRSIDICGPCGSDEALEQASQRGLTSHVEWPIGARIRDALAKSTTVSA